VQTIQPENKEVSFNSSPHPRNKNQKNSPLGNLKTSLTLAAKVKPNLHESTKNGSKMSQKLLKSVSSNQIESESDDYRKNLTHRT